MPRAPGGSRRRPARHRRRLAHLQRPVPAPALRSGDLRAAHHRASSRSPLRLRWSEVAALPGEHQTSDFHCVTGWSVDERALGGHPAADDHRSRAPDGRGEVRDAAVARDAVRRPGLARRSSSEPDAMLARHMDGKPLTRSHGAPLRLVLPSMYGYKGVKWVRELRFDATPDARLLGAARLRRRRLGRQVERLWLGRRDPRFTRTERAAHWLLAATFFVMLFTGLCLSVSAFEGILDRPTAKAWHLWSAIALAAGARADRAARQPPRAGAQRARDRPLRRATTAAGCRARRTRLERGGAAPPQGRFNAGPEAQRRPDRRADARRCT